MPFRSHYENVYKFAIEPALMSVGLAPWKANQAISNIDIMCKMCHAIQQSAYSIIDISDWNPNVMFELGLVYALHKRTLLIKQQHANVPVDLSGMEVINYSRFENLGEKVRTFFEETLKKNEVATWGCFKMGFLDCPMNLENDPQKVFLAMPFRDEQQNMYLFALKPAMERLGLRIWKADEELNNVDFICKLCHAIRTSSFGIVDITGWNPNVMFELGLLYGYGKKVALINKAGEKVPVDLHGLEYVEYNDYGALSQKIEDFFVSSLKTNQ